MNKKKVFGIVGGILLVLLILFLILNPAWVTHTKYMLDSKYCEQDSDCRFAGCYPTNIYTYNLGGNCKSMTGGAICKDNKCSFLPYERGKKE